MDLENPVVKLIMEGMRAEVEQRKDDARALFMQAWHARTDDYDACMAAHYVARHQEGPQGALEWNQKALLHANAVEDERVRTFYPSLCLNLGHSYELLGDGLEAERYYAMAAEKNEALPESPYTEMFRNAVQAGRERIRNLEALD